MQQFAYNFNIDLELKITERNVKSGNNADSKEKKLNFE